MSGPRRVALRSVGCKTNHEEMAAVRSELLASGYALTDDPREADIIVVNTCCVTQAAEGKSRRLVRSLASAAPRARVLVTGCLAQHAPEQFGSAAGVDWVVGNARKHSIADILASGAGGTFFAPLEAGGGLESAGALIAPSRAALTRFPLKIQEGCDFRCSYCIVPAVRGPSRSMPRRAVLGRVREAVGAGYREVVLTGTHIGQYGLRDGTSLVGLLRELARIEGDFRVRLSSIDPRELDDELLGLVAEDPRVCRHLHVSVQSLSDGILRAMGRPYRNLPHLVERLAALRRTRPDLALGGDFIVGFPGESEAMHEETVQGVEAAGFTYGHVFRYSERPATPAASMEGTVPHEERRRRWARLAQRLEEANEAFIRSLAGTTQRVLVEEERPAGGTSGNYLHVSVPGCTARRNHWLDVVIDGPSGDGKNRSTGRAA